jgi:hypothetical protein
MTGFRFPPGDARTTVIGATGSGKTTCGLWLLAHQRLDKRPWIIIDFKYEMLVDRVGVPPIVPLRLDAHTQPPRQPGLYVMTPTPGQEDQLESFLWQVWQKENIGLYIDEGAHMPVGPAFQAILQQGRSKRIPCIVLSQRPVKVNREVFSEAGFFAVYRMADQRDYKVVEGFIPADLSLPLKPFHWRWYDVAYNRLLTMGPVPGPEQVAAQLAEAIPPRYSFHPFGWTSRPSRRRA